MLYKTFEFGLEKRDHIVPAVIAGISALGSLGVGIANSVNANKANEENLRMQRQTNAQNLAMQQQTLEWNKQVSQRDFEYNKQLQDRIFQREDSAVQRMVADNRAAGLSPIAGLSGAGTGQALEANTAYVSAPQSIPAPQMSANQLAIDFSSLGTLANTIQRQNEHEDSLKLEQERLDLQKSSNEENLKLMKSQIDASNIRNEIARATMQDTIEGKKLSNENVKKVIAKNGYEILDKIASIDGKNILNARSQYELDELKSNRSLRDKLGEKQYENLCQIVDNNRLSIQQKTASIAVMLATDERNAGMYGVQLDTLVEEYRQLLEEGEKKSGLKRSLESVGVDSQSASNWQYFWDLITSPLKNGMNFFSR